MKAFERTIFTLILFFGFHVSFAQTGKRGDNTFGDFQVSFSHGTGSHSSGSHSSYCERGDRGGMEAIFGTDASSTDMLEFSKDTSFNGFDSILVEFNMNLAMGNLLIVSINGNIDKFYTMGVSPILADTDYHYSKIFLGNTFDMRLFFLSEFNFGDYMYLNYKKHSLVNFLKITGIVGDRNINHTIVNTSDLTTSNEDREFHREKNIDVDYWSEAYNSAYVHNSSFHVTGKVNDKEQGDWIWYSSNQGNYNKTKPLFIINYKDGEMQTITAYNYIGKRDSVFFKPKKKYYQDDWFKAMRANSHLAIAVDIMNDYHNNYYYNNGQIKQSFDSAKGIKTTYFRDGKTASTQVFTNGKPNGVKKEFYYENGQVSSEIPYTNGIENGVAKLFFKDGVIANQYLYNNGKISGVKKEYWRIGQLSSETPYTNGKINGVKKEFYVNGKIKSKVPYTNGVENGEAKWFFEDGTIANQYHYTNGKMNGVKKEYYYNQLLFSETPYTNGKINGVKKEFYMNGKIRNEIPYTFGIENGEAKGYYENGQLTSEGTFINGEFQLRKEYDENGKIK